MELKYGELYFLSSIIGRIIGECRLPIKSTVKISKFILELNKELEIYKDLNNKIVDEFSEKDEDENPIYEEIDVDGVKQKGNVKLTNKEECIKQLNELAELELTIQFVPINIDDLGDFKIGIQEFEFLNEKLFI